MHHLFMLVVVLALLPAALVTAFALGRILFLLLGAVLAFLAVIFLLANPPVLITILVLISIYFGLIAIARSIVWIVTAIERKWPDILYRIGFGVIGFASLIAAIAISITHVRSGLKLAEGLLIFLAFGTISLVFLWVALSLKTTKKQLLI